MNGKQLTIVLAIFSALVGGVMYGIDIRPIVGYELNEQELYKEINIYEPNLIQQFSMGISNSGKTDAPLILHFACENVTISNTTKKPYYNMKNKEVSILFTVKKDSPQYYFGDNSKVAINVNKSTESFSCKYEVIKNTDDRSMSGIINNFFGEVRGYYPSYFTYKKMDNKFVLQE